MTRPRTSFDNENEYFVLFKKNMDGMAQSMSDMHANFSNVRLVPLFEC